MSIEMPWKGVITVNVYFKNKLKNTMEWKLMIYFDYISWNEKGNSCKSVTPNIYSESCHDKEKFKYMCKSNLSKCEEKNILGIKTYIQRVGLIGVISVNV